MSMSSAYKFFLNTRDMAVQLTPLMLYIWFCVVVGIVEDTFKWKTWKGKAN